jgi:heme exporter protein D
MQFQFASLAEFLGMNGHGPFVWIAYAVTVLVLISLAVAPIFRKRQLQRELLRQRRIAEVRSQRSEVNGTDLAGISP